MKQEIPRNTQSASDDATHNGEAMVCAEGALRKQKVVVLVTSNDNGESALLRRVWASAMVCIHTQWGTVGTDGGNASGRSWDRHLGRHAGCGRSVSTPSSLHCAFAATYCGFEGVVPLRTHLTHASMCMHARTPACTEAHLKANSSFKPLPVAINKADERNWGVCQFLCTLDNLVKLRACGGVQNGTVFESLQTFLFIRGNGRRGHRRWQK